MIRETLIKILSEFEVARRSSFKNHPLAKYIRHDVKKIFSDVLEEQSKDFIIDASPGKGNWVNTPWINIMDERVTSSAEDGYYPVYLFSEDQKTIVLELGQGEYQPRKLYKKDTESVLASRAAIIRSKVPDYKKRFKEDLSKVNLKKGDPVKKRWMASAAFGKIYKINKMPPEDELRKDLFEIIRLYKLSIDRGGISENINQTISFDQDQISVGYEKKIVKHISIENEIIQIDPKFIKKIKHDKNYTCEGCGLNYEKIYGEYSQKKDFIEAHHIEPKFKVKSKVDINKKIERKPEDFAILCANCHRMIHRMMRKENDRVISLEEFKSRISEKYKFALKKLNEKTHS